jgi:hypothetical protein
METYNSNDLSMYFSNLAPRIPPTTAPTIESVDGGVVRNNMSFGALDFVFKGEPNLDLSLAIGLGDSCLVYCEFRQLMIASISPEGDKLPSRRLD